MKINKKALVTGLALIAIIIVVVLIKMWDGIYSTKFLNIDSKKADNIMKNIPKDILADMDNNRHFAALPEEELIFRFKNEFLYDYKPGEITNTYINVKSTLNDKNDVTKKQAIDDVGYLFSSLKFGYAGYKHFGGDEKFNDAKEKIIAEINKSDFDITTNDLEKIVRENLSFIQDGHFCVGDQGTCVRSKMFINEKYEFVRENNTFYLNLKNQKKCVVSINNEEPGKYIKASINKQGYIVYRLCTLNQSDDDMMSLNIKFKDGSSTKVDLQNMVYNYKAEQSKYKYQIKEVYNIPMIKLNSCEQSKELEQFAKDGAKLSKKNIVIIDLRGNPGGSEEYGHQWIENFTKQKYNAANVGSSLCSQISIDAMYATGKKLMEPSQYVKFKEEMNKSLVQTDKEPGLENWSKIEWNNSKCIDNKSTIIVLMDFKTASAGECFIRDLKNLKNTIFIGTNSSGTSNVGNVGLYTLPNSKIQVIFGMSLYIDSDLQWRDGVGIQPDFWVNPNNVDYTALKFIKNYSEGSK